MTETIKNSLIPLDDNRALRAFKDPEGLEPLLIAIETECRAAPVVLNTENGRKNIASLAYKIAQAKNRLDEIGKGLTDESRAFINAINESRRAAWERLETLQKEVRRPLDEWEAAEAQRIKAHETALADIQALAVFPPELPAPGSADIQARIESLENQVKRDFQEYETRAAKFTASTLESLRAALTVAQAREAEEKAAAEWEAIYQAAARENREFDIARAAAKAAREQAEKRAAAEAERVKIENEIALLWEQAHRENAEFDQRAAMAREIKAAAEAWESMYNAACAENEAFDTRQRAEEFARQEAERAAQAERDRQVLEEKKKADAEAARAADEENRQKKIGEAVDAIFEILMDLDDPQNMAFEIVTAISKWEIPNVSIIY